MPFVSHVFHLWLVETGEAEHSNLVHNMLPAARGSHLNNSQWGSLTRQQNTWCGTQRDDVQMLNTCI